MPHELPSHYTDTLITIFKKHKITHTHSAQYSHVLFNQCLIEFGIQTAKPHVLPNDVNIMQALIPQKVFSVRSIE